MAIYHFSAKVISRAAGSSAVAAAAYRSASRLHDERLDRAHDFSAKAGVVHSEILIPEGAPERWRDQAILWNEVECTEKRKDAQLAREIEFAIPRGLSLDEGVELARSFVQGEFVSRGMVADLNVHWDRLPDGSAKPHAHVMLTLREVVAGEGRQGRFGAKARAWNATQELERWREAWSRHANARMQELGIEARIDHRSFEAQGIDLEPQNKIGPAGARRRERGEAAERAAEHREIARRNGERIILDPSIALDTISHQQATFTRHDLARFAHRHSDDKAQFDQVMSAIATSPDLVPLGRDGRSAERFTTREMLEVEARLERAAERLSQQRAHGVSNGMVDAALNQAASGGLELSTEQRDALRYVTGSDGLSLVLGYAGSGKSAMLGVARESWKRAGYRVQGAALSGIAAENLEQGSRVSSRTLASLEHSWAAGRDQLTHHDVLVIDEAGLVGSRQMQRVLDHAEAAGAKVVLVGDPEQLQAIEAGAVFRRLAERHGAVEIRQVRRQQADWQRQATRRLATGRTEDAISAYAAAGHVHEHEDKAAAREALIDAWSRDRAAHPDASQLMLSFTRTGVAALNLAARQRLEADGLLGASRAIETAGGVRAMAIGERVMFLQNERSLGVKNGTVGTVEAMGSGVLCVRLDDGATIEVELKSYAHLDYGYATTIHKAQGVTVDRVQVLASPFMDRHAAYVALSRHRQSVGLHYGKDEFASRQRLVGILARDRSKDMALDYLDPGDRHDCAGREASSPPPGADGRSDRVDAHEALRAFGSAALEVDRAKEAGSPVSAQQRTKLAQAIRRVDGLWRGAARHLMAAIDRSRALIAHAASGRTEPLLRAMVEQRRVEQLRRSPASGRPHDQGRER